MYVSNIFASFFNFFFVCLLVDFLEDYNGSSEGSSVWVGECV